MIRTFQTRRIRREEELTEKLWTFTPLGREETPRSVPVPSCWETYPGFGDYRGEGAMPPALRGSASSLRSAPCPQGRRCWKGR